jgi:hypothetical protein
MDNWPAKTKWTQEYFRKVAGNVQVVMGASSQIVSAQQTRDGSFEKNVKLHEYLDILDAMGPNETDPTYLFQRYTGADILPELNNDFFHPDLFTSFFSPTATSNDSAHDHDIFFYIGSDGSGTDFHRHGNAYNALVAGRKHWYLLPPANPPFAMVGRKMWATQDNATQLFWTVNGAVAECVQHAGEILFVPSEWKHGIYNYGDTLGIAKTLGDPELEELHNRRGLGPPQRGKQQGIPANYPQVLQQQQGYEPPNPDVFYPQQARSQHEGPQQGYERPQQGYEGPQQGYAESQQGYAESQQGYGGSSQYDHERSGSKYKRKYKRGSSHEDNQRQQRYHDDPTQYGKPQGPASDWN